MAAVSCTFADVWLRITNIDVLCFVQAEASVESTVGQLAELKSTMAATVAESEELAAAKAQEVAALQTQLQQVGHGSVRLVMLMYVG